MATELPAGSPPRPLDSHPAAGYNQLRGIAMISIVVCSAHSPGTSMHERNIRGTIGTSCEYLRIDNRGATSGICAAYNRGASDAQGEIVVFVHDDVFFMEPGWGAVLNRKFAEDPSLGMVGVAGTQFLAANKMSWTIAGRPYLRGRVVHDLAATDEFFMSAFSTEPGDCEVVAVDGLFFAVRRSLFDRIRFDEETFDGFHFYDLDICMQARKSHRIIVTWDILVKHCSAGNPDEVWRGYGRKFLAKYREELPACCAGTTPDFTQQRLPGLKFDLRGKASREILC